MALFGRRNDTKAKVGDMLSKAAGASGSSETPKDKPADAKHPKKAKNAYEALARIQAAKPPAAARPAPPPVARPAPPVPGDPKPAAPAGPAQPAARAPAAPKPAVPTAPAAPKPATPIAPPTPKPAASTPAPATSKPAATSAEIDDALAERLAALEKGMSGLKNVQDLSELLSTKYNPFLDIDEEAVFEGQHSPDDLINARVSGTAGKPAWAQASAGFTEAWNDLPKLSSPMPSSLRGASGLPGPDAVPGTPGQSLMAPTLPPPQAPAVPVAPPTQPIVAAPVANQDVADPPVAPRRFGEPVPDVEEKSMYGGKKRSTANAREAFLAMHWFTYLSEGTNPSIIFLYLDYYRYVGWIDEDAYQWLWKLGEGLATPKEGAAWKDFGLDVQRLSSQHLRNLRFIDKLLGTTLQHGEADYLRQTTDMLLMED